MSKFKLSKGKKEEPEFFVLFGVEGIGKTTFACGAPNPVVLDIEGGSNQVDTVRIDEDQLQSVQAINEAIKELMENPDCETIVVDSLTRYEAILFKSIAKQHGKGSVAEVPWGVGYSEAQAKTLEFIELCKKAKKSGKNVILIAHNKNKNFNDPTQLESYARYELELNEKIAGVIKKEVDAIYFANYKTLVKDGKGLDSGQRLLYTQRKPGHDAKNRFGLPYEIELEWGAYMKAKKNSVETPDQYVEEIKVLATEIQDEETRKKVLSSIEGETNIIKLKNYISRCNDIIFQQ